MDEQQSTRPIEIAKMIEKRYFLLFKVFLLIFGIVIGYSIPLVQDDLTLGSDRHNMIIASMIDGGTHYHWLMLVPLAFVLSMLVSEDQDMSMNDDMKKTNDAGDAHLRAEILKLKKIQLALQEKWKAERDQRTKLHRAYKDLYTRFKANAQVQGNFQKEKESRIDLQKAYKELKDTQEKLVQAEKMSSLGKLTAGIAHEINNPVNFVANGVRTLRENIEQLMTFIDNYKKIGQLDSLEEIKKYTAILEEDEEDLIDLRESTQELLDDADYGTERITEIVKGLRSFSRQDDSESTEANINDIIEAALVILKPKYKKIAVIEKNLAPNLRPIHCFPSQINQVFVNLIGNACDAIDGQGVIAITTLEMSPDHIEIRLKDNGRGMAEDVKNKIFDPFFTTKEVGKGTGLGLSITYGIIKNQ